MTAHSHRLARRLTGWLAAAVLFGLTGRGAGFAGGAPEETAVTVWATGDCVRVDPQSGRYREDRADIHSDYPGGDYRRRNALWDAAAQAVTLRAARNEIVAFQVIVEPSRPVSNVRVRLDRLVGPEGAAIAGRNLAILKAWYVRVTARSSGYEKLSLGPGWYPDALLPTADDNGSLRFDVPDPANGIGPGQRNQTVWVDVCVPRDRANAPPGEYRGELAVSWPGGRQMIGVSLSVWDFALPERTHLAGDIWNGSLRRMDPDLELAFYQMARRHRFQPGVAGYRPGVSVRGTEVAVDWSDYDARLAKYFDGSAFTEAHGYWGPGRGVPLGHVLLPFDVDWPVAVPEQNGKEEAEAVWLETARRFKAHFDADPFRRAVRKIVFIGRLDESYDEAAYRKMIYYCDLLRKATGRRWFDYRIDGGYGQEAMEKLQGHVDLWVCHTIGFDRDKIAHFRRQGVEAWFYGPMIYERRGNSACGSNTFTDLDLLTCRGVGWAAWKHRSGFCQWEFDAFYDEKTGVFRPEDAGDRAWREAINCRYGNGRYNGSGLLIYRGEPMGLDGPVASIRLKAHRRGFQDYEYFWLLQQCGEGATADGLVDSVVHAVPFGSASIGNTEVWRNDPEVWEKARRRAGDLLHAQR
ncbi:MAG: glycoside hydrolase domain-containing protein [Planctomycetota bacterium]|jgi:hypothetical protein